jgi:hypothetical protein
MNNTSIKSLDERMMVGFNISYQRSDTNHSEAKAALNSVQM